MEKISLTFLAKAINIRQKRLYTKAQKMRLIVHEEKDDLYLSRTEVIQLLKDYVQSRRVSVQTQERALAVLNSLSNGGINAIESPPQTRNRKDKSLLVKRLNKARKGKVKLKWIQQWPLFCTLLTKTLIDSVAGIVLPLLKSIVHFLQSVYFKFVALFVAIMLQMHHSAIWFYRVRPEGEVNSIAAWCYAFMVDLFILVVTLEGKMAIAKTFAWLTFISNILYFQFWLGFDYSPEAFTKAISAIIISAVIAYVIYAYTELFVNAQQTEELS